MPAKGWQPPPGRRHAALTMWSPARFWGARGRPPSTRLRPPGPRRHHKGQAPQSRPRRCLARQSAPTHGRRLSSCLAPARCPARYSQEACHLPPLASRPPWQQHAAQARGSHRSALPRGMAARGSPDAGNGAAAPCRQAACCADDMEPCSLLGCPGPPTIYEVSPARPQEASSGAGPATPAASAPGAPVGPNARAKA